MSCRKCGGGASVTQKNDLNPAQNAEMILIEYVGEQGQKRRLKSKYNPREQYVFGGGTSRLYVYRADLEWLLNIKDQFKRVETASVEQEIDPTKAPVLVSHTRPINTDLPLDALTLDPVVVALLKRKFRSVDEVKRAGRAEWLTIKGIGASRADAIEEAIRAVQK